MLKRYMESDEFLDELEKVVVESPEFKEKENEYLNALKSLSLDRTTHDEVDATVTFMIDAARKLAYGIGFTDGVSLVTECVSAGRSSRAVDYNQALKREDYKRAWDLKASAHNRLYDLLESHGVDEATALKAIEEHCTGVELFTSLSAKLNIPVTD